MLGQHSFAPYPQMRFGLKDGKHAISAVHTPRQNHLLAALPVSDCERLLPDLEPVACRWVGPFTAPVTGNNIYISSPRA